MDLRKRTSRILTAPLILGMLFIFFSPHSCKRFEPDGFVHVNTGELTEIAATSARCSGDVTDDGGAVVRARGICWDTSNDPTVSGDTTMEGTGIGRFISTLEGLTPGATYFVRAYVTNSEGTVYGKLLSFKTWISDITVTDIDGNVYQTVLMGDKRWMAENLKTTHYPNGSTIPFVEDASEWIIITETDPAYCWYDNNSNNQEFNGGLYNWSAAMNGSQSSTDGASVIQGVCPDGWHLPSDAEWMDLEVSLGMSRTVAENRDWRGSDEGGKLKEAGTSHWFNPNVGATNSSLFTSLPGGLRNNEGNFTGLTHLAVYWTATGVDGSGWNRLLSFDRQDIARDNYNIGFAFSVRCVEGDGSMVNKPTVITDAATSVGETWATLNGIVTDDGGADVTDRGYYYGSSADPASTGTRIEEGSGTGSFSYNVSGLAQGSDYYFVAYATNSAGTAFGLDEGFTTSSISGDIVIDIDGNEYPTVEIGDQLWMAENLKTTSYADGTAIPLVEGISEWDALSSTGKAYCWYDNSGANKHRYGGLYSWAAAMKGASSNIDNPSGIQGVCPSGWHLPSDEEWKQLDMVLGLSRADADLIGWPGTDEGGQMKEEGFGHWDSPNTGATNSSGFTALPGGYRYPDGTFNNEGYSTGYWTTTEENVPGAWIRYLNAANESRHRNINEKEYGFSVRCVKGNVFTESPSVNTLTISEVTDNNAVGGGEVISDGGAEVTSRGVCWSTSPSPTISSETTQNGKGIGAFVSTLIGLTASTTYYVRAYAINSVGTAYGGEMQFTTSTSGGNTVTDIDGNSYQTIVIGSQLWMAENLKTTRYADGEAIPLVEGSTEWDALTETDQAYCWYDNSSENRDIYGGLYTWAAAMKGMSSSDASPSGVQGVCPESWHLPSDEEWKQLEMYLGLSRAEADADGSYRGTDEGGKMKETGTDHWASPNTSATNESGFSALPGGYRNPSASFIDKTNYAYFWTSTEGGGTYGPHRQLHYESAGIGNYNHNKYAGLSIRCVGD